MSRRTKAIALTALVVVGIGAGWFFLDTSDPEVRWHRALARGDRIRIEVEDGAYEIQARELSYKQVMADAIIEWYDSRNVRTEIMKAKYAEIRLEPATQRVLLHVEQCDITYPNSADKEVYVEMMFVPRALREPALRGWLRKLRQTLGL